MKSGKRGSVPVAPGPGAMPICSRCKRMSGRACRHSRSPFRRYVTSTRESRLSSPEMRHSNPSETSVGGSTTNSPAIVALWTFVCACRGSASRSGTKTRDRRMYRSLFYRLGTSVDTSIDAARKSARATVTSEASCSKTRWVETGRSGAVRRGMRPHRDRSWYRRASSSCRGSRDRGRPSPGAALS